jgi:hypothetical protein
MNKEFFEKLSKENKDLIFSIASKEYKYMAHNWFLHLKKIGLEDQSIVMCSDFDTVNYLKENNVNCMFFADDLENTVKIEQINKFYNLNHEMYLVLIVESLFKKYNFNLLLSDVDMIFLKNPLPYFNNELMKNFDGYFYQNIDRNETSIENKKIFGNIVFFTKKSFFKIQNAIQSIETLDMENLDIQGISNIFNLNLKVLNNYLFCHSSLIETKNVDLLLKDTIYCIHYSDMEINGFLKQIDYNLNASISKKINLMKKHNNWLI